MKVYLVAGKRTPIGSLGGVFANVPAVQLGALAMSGLIESSGIKKELVKEVVVGNVLSSGLGQNPAR